MHSISVRHHPRIVFFLRKAVAVGHVAVPLRAGHTNPEALALQQENCHTLYLYPPNNDPSPSET